MTWVLAGLVFVPPADGFVAGREDRVGIAVLDSAGALTIPAGTPVVTARRRRRSGWPTGSGR